MKRYTKWLILCWGCAIFLSGCAKKEVVVGVLEPAKVDVLSKKKHIAVSEFRNDRVGLAGRIEANLAKVRIDGKRYFKVVNRQQLKKILAEQKLQSSELIDASTVSRLGRILGVEAMITGEIANASGRSGSYLQNKKECLRYYKDGSGCAKWRFFKVRCHTISAAISANIDIIDVETATILYGDTYNEAYSADSCKDGDILSKNQALNSLSDEIAQDFTLKLVPHYLYLRVSLLEELDAENATDSQEKRFENALKYIEAKRLKRAEEILQTLLDEINGESYVVAYDLGVVKEALGKLQEARRLYELADKKSPEPIEEINRAVLRVEKTIKKRELAKEQMGL